MVTADSERALASAIVKLYNLFDCIGGAFETGSFFLNENYDKSSSYSYG